jgi:hypothetical protein
VRVDIASPLIESGIFSAGLDPKRARSLAVSSRSLAVRCEELAWVAAEELGRRACVVDTLSDTATDAPSPPPAAAAEEEAAREAEAEEAKARSAWRLARCLELRTLAAACLASLASLACWMSCGTALMCANIRINVATVIA